LGEREGRSAQARLCIRRLLLPRWPCHRASKDTPTQSISRPLSVRDRMQSAEAQDADIPDYGPFRTSSLMSICLAVKARRWASESLT
jgi:hypothetical protein